MLGVDLLSTHEESTARNRIISLEKRQEKRWRKNTFPFHLFVILYCPSGRKFKSPYFCIKSDSETKRIEHMVKCLRCSIPDRLARCIYEMFKLKVHHNTKRDLWRRMLDRATPTKSP